MTTRKEVALVIAPVCDPEIRLSVVDLGLIYGINVEDGCVSIAMTLTTPMCPYGPQLREMVRQAALQANGVKEAKVDLVWEPLWDPRTMTTDEVRVELGLAW